MYFSFISITAVRLLWILVELAIEKANLVHERHRNISISRTALVRPAQQSLRCFCSSHLDKLHALTHL